MKLCSFSADGRDRVGVGLPSGRIVDLADVPGRPAWPTDMLSVIRLGDHGITVLEEAVRAGGAFAGVRAFDPDEILWYPPVRDPSNIVCLAANNRALDSIKIRAPTDHPAFFNKPRTVLVGHRQPIMLQASYGLTHPEPELAVVVGKVIRNATPARAMAAVFGYSAFNDVTSVGMREEDSFSLRVLIPRAQDGELVPTEVHTTYPGRYKGADTFGPMGPFLVTRGEIPDPSSLTITCRMGEAIVARDSVRNYVWDVGNALSIISRTNTLHPGDVVTMGTATDAAENRTASIPGILKANLNGFIGSVTVEITSIGRLENPIAMR